MIHTVDTVVTLTKKTFICILLSKYFCIRFYVHRSNIHFVLNAHFYKSICHIFECKCIVFIFLWVWIGEILWKLCGSLKKDKWNCSHLQWVNVKHLTSYIVKSNDFYSVFYKLHCVKAVKSSLILVIHLMVFPGEVLALHGFFR